MGTAPYARLSAHPVECGAWEKVQVLATSTPESYVDVRRPNQRHLRRGLTQEFSDVVRLAFQSYVPSAQFRGPCLEVDGSFDEVNSNPLAFRFAAELLDESFFGSHVDFEPRVRALVARWGWS